MADKETLSLWMDMSEMQHFILKVDTPCHITSLVVATRVNKMKSWYRERYAIEVAISNQN